MHQLSAKFAQLSATCWKLTQLSAKPADFQQSGESWVRLALASWPANYVNSLQAGTIMFCIQILNSTYLPKLGIACTVWHYKESWCLPTYPSFHLQWLLTGHIVFVSSLYSWQNIRNIIEHHCIQWTRYTCASIRTSNKSVIWILGAGQEYRVKRDKAN